MNLQEQVNLQSCNTLAVPATAEYFVRCTDVEDLCAALRWAQDNKQRFRVLAGGSNVVLAEFLPGVTIVPDIKGVNVIHETPENIELQIGAGENWHELVMSCVRRGWYGIENLALIPGSVGAAPIQNIGAYGVEVKQFIQTVSVLDIQTLDEAIFSPEECLFAYRESVFKSTNRYIVTFVGLNLSKQEKALVTYPVLKDYLSTHALTHTPANIMNAVIQIRQTKLPDPAKLPNAGSFFKNPVVSKSKYANLLSTYSDLVGFEQENGEVKIAAAWLIDQCGWKGRKVNGVGVHADHALVIVNTEKKPAKNILALAKTICEDVKEKFGIELEQEPRILS